MSLIQILTKDEEKIFELPPSFDSFAKNHFFKLTSGISEIILEMKNDSNKILFILMFGYFKATITPLTKYPKINQHTEPLDV